MAKPRCFYRDGYMYCEYIIRNGQAIYPASGGWFKFPAGGSKKAKRQAVEEPAVTVEEQ